ncbi:MAG: hypothetical protein WDN49_09600 [Acetobacteraceae bacterium]
MKPMLTLLPAVALLAAVGRPALAQDATPAAPSPEQAHVLEQQVRSWLMEVMNQKVMLSQRPVQFTPQGDHYLVSVPFGFISQIKPADAALTVQAKMLDATRWQLDNQTFPSPLTITYQQQVKDAPDEKNPSKTGMHAETVTTILKLGDQTNTATFDPTFATATTGQSSVASIDVTQTGGNTPMTTHFGRITGQTSTRPVDPAHVDILVDGAGEGYLVTGQGANGNAYSFAADRVHVVSAVSGFTHDSFIPVIRALSAFGIASEAAKKKPDDKIADAANQAAGHTLLTAAKGLLTGMRVDESLEGVKFNVAGHSGTLSKVEFAAGGDAPQDMLSANLSFTLDGLALPELPPQLADYVPTHIAIRPTLSNVSVADLTKMGMDATAPGGSGKPSPADEAALFQHGGINFGFDTLELDVAGTKFAGTGKFVLTGPQVVSGQAEISATGLDALITKAQADPMLAQGVPVVIFLKGIAHTTGDQAVWQISVADKKVLVNGVDLSAIAGGMK